MKIYCARQYSIDSILGKDLWVYLSQHKMWCKVTEATNLSYICDILRGRPDMIDFMLKMPIEYRINTRDQAITKVLSIDEYKDDIQQALKDGEFFTTNELFGLYDEE
ncbi:MAG: hypothetical protein J5725_08880 [Bacteroidales bacterium]|nr:hypothetical protein [Bacteroidales bacterium]